MDETSFELEKTNQRDARPLYYGKTIQHASKQKKRRFFAGDITSAVWDPNPTRQCFQIMTFICAYSCTSILAIRTSNEQKFNEFWNAFE